MCVFVLFIPDIRHEGLTWEVIYNQSTRSLIKFNLITFVLYELQIGTWNPKKKVNITKTYKESRNDVLKELANKTLRVVTVIVSKMSAVTSL